jgi:hypothetical protein
VLDLTTLGYALRLRWEWLARTEPRRLWTQLPSCAKRIVRAMFEVSVIVQIRDRARALFWSDRWLDGAVVASTAPLVVAAVSLRCTSSGRWRMRSRTRAGYGTVRDLCPYRCLCSTFPYGPECRSFSYPASLTASSRSGQQTSNTRPPPPAEPSFSDSAAFPEPKSSPR